MMAAGASDLTPKDLAEARDAADRFFQAVQRGDEAAALERLILGAGEKMDFKNMHESTARVELGEATPEGANVVVESRVYGPAPAGEPEPPAQPLPLILRQVDGAWKIDMGASINRMLGVDLTETVTQLAKGLGDAMAKGMEAVTAGLSALGGAPAAAEEEGFREAVESARQRDVPSQAARLSEMLGKNVDLAVAWHSLGGKTDAVCRMNPLVLDHVEMAVRSVCGDAESMEKLRGALDRVVIWHVPSPVAKLCVLDGGQLEMAVCLVDCPDHDDLRGYFVGDEIAESLRQAIQ